MSGGGAGAGGGARGGNERTRGTPPAAGTPQQPWVGKLLQLAGSGGEKDVDQKRVSCVPSMGGIQIYKGGRTRIVSDG